MSTQHGNGENNILQGTTDADTLIGHGGDDTYIVNHAGDVVQELVRVSSNLANSPGEITRISISQAGSQVNGNSYNASFSPDGSKLLFHSYASNLITGDTNTRSDVFIKDLLTGQVTRVSTNTAGAQVNGSSLNASFSPDGTKVLFYSEATNLVANDTNNRADIFIKDLMTGAVTRVNTTTLGEQANNYSDNARFTADGTSVVFDSNEGLSPDDTDGNPDIFIKNLMTGDITLASTTRDGDNIRLHSSKGIISPDGSKLSFEVVYDYTFVSSSGAHYAKHYDYIMIKDLNTGEIVDTLGGQLLLPGSSILQYTGKASFSEDNTKVIFYSNVDLLNSSTLVHEDCIFIKDLIGGGIEKIGAGNDPQFFDNDTKVIYRNGTDVYVKDLVGGTISCISRDENGNPVTGASAANFKVSPFSDQVLFESDSNGWVTGDTNNVSDIFIKDISSLYAMQDGGGADTVESSVSYTLPEFVENLILTGTANINGTGNALDNSITGNSGNNNIDGKQGADSALGGAGNDIYYIDEDGDRVIEYHETVEWQDAGYIYNEQDDGGYDKIFSSIDFGLVDKFYDYQHVDSGETRTLTSGLYVEEIELTGSGDLKAFGNYQDNKLIGNTGNNILDGGSGNDVLDGRAGADILRGGSGNDTYIVDQLDVIEEFELPGNTATKINNAEGVGLNGNSADPFLSTDGKKLVFSSFADNLVAGDTNATSDLFVKDLTSGQISRVSLSANAGEANGSSFGGKFTSDATRVVFDSAASNLLAADNNQVRDVFIKDLISGGVVQVSTASNGAQANGASYAADVNANGSKVVFESDATNLVAGDTNSKKDIFVKDFSTGQTMQVSTGMNGEQANDASVEADISADGTKIIFTSWASNLVQNDTNNARDIFVKDLLTGKITRVSTGTDGQQGDADSRDAMISADGRKVVFMSDATNLVDNDTNGVSDIFVKDLVTGQITRVSTTAAGSQLDMESYYASISADGKKVSFMSFAKHLGNEYNSD